MCLFEIYVLFQEILEWLNLQMHFVVEKPLPIYSEKLMCNSSEYTLDATAYWLGFRKVPIIRNYVGVSGDFVIFHIIVNYGHYIQTNSWTLSLSSNIARFYMIYIISFVGFNRCFISTSITSDCYLSPAV